MRKSYSSIGMTLVELLISVLLLAVIILTAVTVELSTRRMNLAADLKTLLLNDLIFVKEKIKKEAFYAVGNASAAEYPFNACWDTTGVAGRLTIRNDTNMDGVYSAADDRTSFFYWRSVGGATNVCWGLPGNPTTEARALYFFPNSGDLNNFEILARNITNFQPIHDLSEPRKISVIIQKTRRPTEEANIMTNPNATIRFSLTARQSPPFN